MTALSGRLAIDGHRITDREVRRGLRINILAGAVGIMWFTVVMNYPLTMLLDCLGASGTLIGAVTMGMQLAMIVQVPASLYAERLPARRPLWGWVTMAHRPLLLVPAVLPFIMDPANPWVPWLICGIMFISLAMMHTVAPLWFSWMADFVPDTLRGRFWGLRQSVLMGMNLATVALAGLILDIWPDPKEPGGSYVGFLVLFSIAAVMGTLDIVIHLWVPEPRPRPVESSAKPLSRILAPLRDTDFLWLTLAIAVWMFSISFGGQFGNLYLKRAFAVSYKSLSTIAITGSVGAIMASIVFGTVIDRIGARAFGIMVMALGPLTCLPWFFIDSSMPWWLADVVTWTGLPQPVAFIVAQAFLAGTFYMGIPLVQMGLISVLAPKQGRTMAMAVHLSVVGIMASMGSLTAGRIVDAFPTAKTDWIMPTGSHFGFIHLNLLIHIILAWCVAIPMLLKVRIRQGDLPLSTAMGRLIVLNPLRALRNIYSISTPANARQRAKAVRDLGETRTAIALSDLIERLDDASADVREEAAFALGRIGSPDAVDALVEKLNDPNTDIKPHIARALREAGDPRSVDALVGNLQEQDRETQSETARTLGAIGDRRAVTSLLDVLKSTGDDKVASASSAALARLGEVAAIHEILPRMKRTRNPVLKRSLAVAVGDLLGEPDGFYRILASEQSAHGVEVERMIKSIRRKVVAMTKSLIPAGCGSVTQKLDKLQTAYEEEEIPTCADLLFDLAIGIAALKHGVRAGVETEVLIEELIWKDERFGIGVWYLNVLRERWEAAGLADRDTVDILLGIYFLYCVDMNETPGGQYTQSL